MDPKKRAYSPEILKKTEKINREKLPEVNRKTISDPNKERV